MVRTMMLALVAVIVAVTGVSWHPAMAQEASTLSGQMCPEEITAGRKNKWVRPGAHPYSGTPSLAVHYFKVPDEVKKLWREALKEGSPVETVLQPGDRFCEMFYTRSAGEKDFHHIWRNVEVAGDWTTDGSKPSGASVYSVEFGELTYELVEPAVCSNWSWRMTKKSVALAPEIVPAPAPEPSVAEPAPVKKTGPAPTKPVVTAAPLPKPAPTKPTAEAAAPSKPAPSSQPAPRPRLAKESPTEPVVVEVASAPEKPRDPYEVLVRFWEWSTIPKPLQDRIKAVNRNESDATYPFEDGAVSRDLDKDLFESWKNKQARTVGKCVFARAHLPGDLGRETIKACPGDHADYPKEVYWKRHIERAIALDDNAQFAVVPVAQPSCSVVYPRVDPDRREHYLSSRPGELRESAESGSPGMNFNVILDCPSASKG